MSLLLFVSSDTRVHVSVRPSNFFPRKTYIDYRECRPSCMWLLNGPAAPVILPSRLNGQRRRSRSNQCGNTYAVFTLGPVLFRILANRTRRIDLASGLHSHYKRLTRRERYAPTSPCTHCVCFATGCNPITCT